MMEKARLFGRAQYYAVQKDWSAVASAFDALAEAEDEFTSAVLGAKEL